jgi:predicted nuclease of predicted toxin-antitoxin system
MMIKFYSNEHFPLEWVNELRNLGYDVLTSQEAGQANQSISDPDVLKFAHEQNRVVITLNRQDFLDLHKEGKAHSGIIICKDFYQAAGKSKQKEDYLAQTAFLHNFLQNDNKSLKGRLIRIKKKNQKGDQSQGFVIQEY